jgi:hypothetical protein
MILWFTNAEFLTHITDVAELLDCICAKNQADNIVNVFGIDGLPVKSLKSVVVNENIVMLEIYIWTYNRK